MARVNLQFTGSPSCNHSKGFEPWQPPWIKLNKYITVLIVRAAHSCHLRFFTHSTSWKRRIQSGHSSWCWLKIGRWPGLRSYQHWGTPFPSLLFISRIFRILTGAIPNLAWHLLESLADTKRYEPAMNPWYFLGFFIGILGIKLPKMYIFEWFRTFSVEVCHPCYHDPQETARSCQPRPGTSTATTVAFQLLEYLMAAGSLGS